MDVASRRACARGFSVVDLVVTLTALLILLGVGVPAMQRLLADNATSSIRNRLAGGIQFARLGAITRTQALTLCPSRDLRHCSGDYTAWHRGIILFADRNANRRRDPGEPLLRVIQDIPPQVRIRSSRGRRSIRFAPDGSAWGSNLTLRLCSPGTPEANRAIILYGSGRMRFSRRLPNGQKIRCDTT